MHTSFLRFRLKPLLAKRHWIFCRRQKKGGRLCDIDDRASRETSFLGNTTFAQLRMEDCIHQSFFFLHITANDNEVSV